MSSNISALKAMARSVRVISEELQETQKALTKNTTQLEKVNKAHHKAEVKRQQQVEKELKQASMESSRYPLVETSDPGMKADIDLNLKKLNII